MCVGLVALSCSLRFSEYQQGTGVWSGEAGGLGPSQYDQRREYISLDFSGCDRALGVGSGVVIVHVGSFCEEIPLLRRVGKVSSGVHSSFDKLTTEVPRRSFTRVIPRSDHPMLCFGLVCWCRPGKAKGRSGCPGRPCWVHCRVSVRGYGSLWSIR